MENSRARKTRIVVGAIISTIIFGFAIPVTYGFAVNALDLVLGLPAQPIGRPVNLILAALTLALGLFWIFWSYSYLVFVGKGSPVEAFGVALEPTRHLVTAGPYAYVRHPMTFGLLLVLFGVAFVADSIMGLALVPIIGLIIALYLRFFEEKKLVERFGGAYEHYREHVSMLVPQPSPYVSPVTPTEPHPTA